MTTRISALRRATAALAVAAAAVTGLVACSSSDDSSISYQAMPGMPLVIELADALGYYEGDITLNYKGTVSGGPESAQNVAAGSVDLGQVYNGAITKIASEGVPIKAVVAGYGFNEHVDSLIVTRKGSGINGARDLIGKKVAVNTLGASYEAFTDTWLRSEGLTDEEIKQVTLVPLPPINSPAAVEKGEVDAAGISSSILKNLPNPEAFETVLSYSKYYGSRTDGSLVVSERTVKERPDQLRALVSGAGRAFDWARENGPEATKAKLTEYLTEKGHKELVNGLGFWSGSFGVDTPGGRLTDTDFSQWNQWLIADKQVSGDIKAPDEVYTNEFNTVGADS